MTPLRQFHLRQLLRVVAVCLWPLTLASLLMGCFGGEDHWAHYEGGGDFAVGPPIFSPDGSAVVFATPCSGRGDIVRVNRDGTGRVRLAASEDYEAYPVYSPDGARIAYVRERNGDRHIWVMNADGSGQRQLTTGRVMDDRPGFSDDGSQILFGRSLRTGGLGRTLEFYSVGADAKGLKRLTLMPAQFAKDGVETLDGKWIYFLSLPYAQDLCVKNADGSGERVIPAPRGYKLGPTLSRDGRALVLGVLTRGKRHPDVVLIDVATERILGQLSEDCGPGQEK